MKSKESVRRTIKIPTKITPYFQIGILFPDGKKISKLKLEKLDDVFDTYFLSLDKYLVKNYDAEQLYELYQKTYSNKEIKVAIHYIDSWGHLWKGKHAWPKKEWFIDYLNKKMSANK